MKKKNQSDRVALTVRIPGVLHRELKEQSFHRQVSLQSLVEEYLQQKRTTKKVDTSWLKKLQAGPLKIKGKLHRHHYYEA